MGAIATSLAFAAVLAFLSYLAHLGFGVWLVNRTGDSKALLHGATYERAWRRRAGRVRGRDDDDPSPPGLQAVG